MDAETVARKLEPLMPQRVERWRRHRELADPELRALLDRQLLLTARKVLGEPGARPLLSLPPEGVIRGRFHVGRVLYESEKWEAGLRESELIQHALICGRSGSGKSNLAFHLMSQLVARRVPFLFLDMKRTARHALVRLGPGVRVYTPGRDLLPLPFDPFVAPDGLDAESYFAQALDVMSAAFDLGSGSQLLLQRAWRARATPGKRAPGVSQLLDEIQAMPVSERSRGWKTTAVKALEGLSWLRGVDADLDAQASFAASLLHGRAVLELDGLSQRARAFLVPLLMLWLYQARLAAPDRERLAMAILIDDAQGYLYSRGPRAGESLMERLWRLCREVGIALVALVQNPQSVSSAVLGNTFATIVFNLKDPADLAKAAALTQLEESDRPWLGRLPVGQAVVKLQDRWRRPFLVRVPLVRVAKGSVSDADLAALQERSPRAETETKARSPPGAPASEDVHDVRRVLSADEPLQAGELAFLEDVLTHRLDGVRARYRRLGLSGERGHRLKGGLVRRGWLDARMLPSGRTRKLVLGLTSTARLALGMENGTRRESLAHEYYKRYYARQAQGLGLRTTLEAARTRGRVDVLAEGHGVRLGIEIETGESDVISNVRNCLASGLRVVVVATGPKALETIESRLGGAGLLIPGRVLVVPAPREIPRSALNR